MAEHTRKFYTCDRCGVEMDQPVRGGERGPTAFTLHAHQDFGVGGGALISWSHLCTSCNSACCAAIKALAKEAGEARVAIINKKGQGDG